jgi:hypothetical protein
MRVPGVRICGLLLLPAFGLPSIGASASPNAKAHRLQRLKGQDLVVAPSCWLVLDEANLNQS